MKKRVLGLTTLLTMTLLAAPALAQSRPGVVVLTPGARTAGASTQQQPTSFLTTETATVLPDGLAYISTGATFGGGLLNYQRGMGGGGELDVVAGLNLTTGAATTFGAGVGAGWKQMFSSVGAMGVAANGNVFVGGIGATPTIAAQLGLPLTFGAGMGMLTVHPRLTFPSLTAGTAGATVGAGVGLQTPLATHFSLIAEVSPNFGLGGGGFTLPVGAGVRFSPTATSHVDLTLGQLGALPTFTANLGLVGVTAHVGF